MATGPGSNLEAQIRSQPAELERLVRSAKMREQIHSAAEGLHRARRIWLVGTGTSLHAAELGAAMIQQTGRSAVAVPSMQFVAWAPVIGPQDAIVVITHTAETAYALSTRAQAFLAGLQLVMITREGAGFPEVIETVPKETAETYTVSYTTALLALAVIARELGAEGFEDEVLVRIPEAVADAIADSGTDQVALPERALVIAGAGPASITAREGALKIREGARVLAEGYDAEYLLHGSAVPLTVRDGVVILTPPDHEGFMSALGRAAADAGIPVSGIHEPSDLSPLLAQIPLTVRLQILAYRFAAERGQDPDTVITGSWADPDLWRIGAPRPS
jgi:glucosamine--fructose-6-phosphate aminotransferase (isomerizing)